LQELRCDFVAARDAAVLRGIKTLAKINDQPASAFWIRVGPVVASTPASSATRSTTTSVTPSGPKTGSASTTAPASTVGSVSTKEQIRRFVAKMKEMNPEWDGETKHVAERGKIVELKFSSIGVTNISAVVEVRGLRSLICRGFSTMSSPFSDLSPLKGLSLNELDCTLTRVKDLSPLQGMPLRLLRCNATNIEDLTPLAGMKLVTFGCNYSAVTDLTPLRGMPLEELSFLGTRVSDISSLKGMPLRQLIYDFAAERDAAILRSLKTLETVNGLPVKEFWKRVKAGEAPQPK